MLALQTPRPEMQPCLVLLTSALRVKRVYGPSMLNKMQGFVSLN